jgi:hypothetical protein
LVHELCGKLRHLLPSSNLGGDICGRALQKRLAKMTLALKLSPNPEDLHLCENLIQTAAFSPDCVRRISLAGTGSLN